MPATSLFRGTERILCNVIQLLRCNTVKDCDWEKTAPYQPAPDQQSLSYPSWKYTALPVTGLAHGAVATGLQHEHGK